MAATAFEEREPFACVLWAALASQAVLTALVAYAAERLAPAAVPVVKPVPVAQPAAAAPVPAKLPAPAAAVVPPLRPPPPLLPPPELPLPVQQLAVLIERMLLDAVFRHDPFHQILRKCLNVLHG